MTASLTSATTIPDGSDAPRKRRPRRRLTVLLVGALAVLANHGVHRGISWAQQVPSSSVQLELQVANPVLTEGQQVNLELWFRNSGSQPVRVVSPLDGSFDNMREPRYTVEFLDTNGAVVPHALGPPVARCGLTNPLEPARDVFTVMPGQRRSAYQSPNTFRFEMPVQAAARPGRYQVRVRYQSSLSQATALRLTSNAVSVEITGGNLARWTCYHDLVQHRQQQQFADVRMPQLLPLQQGYLFAYQFATHSVQQGQDSATHTTQVQLLDAQFQPIAAPTSIARIVDAGALALLPTNTGALLVATSAPTPGAQPSSLLAVPINTTGNSVQPGSTTVLSRTLASGYHLATSHHALGSIVVFQVQQPRDVQLVSQRFALDGSLVGAARTITTLPTFASTLVVPDGNDFLIAWAEGPRGFRAATMGVQGAATTPQVLAPGLVGELAGIHRTASGLALAFNRNVQQGSNPQPMGLYLQNLTSSGTSIGVLQTLSQGRDASPQWGRVVWPGADAMALFEDPIVESTTVFSVQQHRRLQALRAGGSTITPSERYLGDLAVQVQGNAVLATWRDARDDHSVSCERARECVGEAYVATFDAAGRLLQAPLRLTHLAIPQTAAISANWQASCP